MTLNFETVSVFFDTLDGLLVFVFVLVILVGVVGFTVLGSATRFSCINFCCTGLVFDATNLLLFFISLVNSCGNATVVSNMRKAINNKDNVFVAIGNFDGKYFYIATFN